MTEEEAIVAAEAEEAIKDKDKSSHRLIGGSNKDEGSDSDSGEIPAAAPAKADACGSASSTPPPWRPWSG